ncbi:hypothetical protein [Leptolyngbya sp. FACHB-17]|nr:hypothetical protein [Leptolyngbya sp. FACHB-17]MBD2080161.1 hypothetical protein [Leptolyngbya sp. FACHB-17]
MQPSNGATTIASISDGGLLICLRPSSICGIFSYISLTVSFIHLTA